MQNFICIVILLTICVLMGRELIKFQNDRLFEKEFLKELENEP